MIHGRINRATFWLGVVTVIGLFFVITNVLHLQMPAGEVLLGLLCVPRLHDIGRSGWLVLYVAALELIVGLAVTTIFGLSAAFAVVGFISLSILALVAWLGSIPGEPASNRFGAPPAAGLNFKAQAKM